MRTVVGLVTLLGLLVAGRAAVAAPIAAIRDDVDGDGTADPIELSADGRLRIGAANPAELRLAPAVATGRILVARTAAAVQLVVELVTATTDEAVVIAREGAPDEPGPRNRTSPRGGWHEVTRFPLGGVGLDREYRIEVDATPSGIVRYQTSSRVKRCDGKPTYLFPERLDGAVFRAIATPPTNVAATAPALPARPDPAAAPPPLVYQARAASHQVGISDAGGLGIPSELDDGRPGTLWREDLAASAGEGQFFTFQPRVDGARAQQIRIVPGNPTSIAAMRAVNRPRMLAVVSAQGAWRFELPDVASEPLGAAFSVDLPQPIAGCVTIVLETTYGRPHGATAIAELEVYAEGERTDGGAALLARVVADGKPGATSAAATLARQGAAGAAAIDGELARTTDPAARRRLIGALVKVRDPAAGPALVRAATSGWVRDQDLLDVIGALAAAAQPAALRDLVVRAELPAEVRAAAATGLAPTGAGFDALLELAGKGPRVVRHAVIERLALAAAPALHQAATSHATASGAGDLWRALTRHARSHPAARPALVAAMTAALPTTIEYERRYRLVDGIAAHGDAAALRALELLLHDMPAGAETSALRQVAIRGAATAPRPEATPLLVGLATDLDPGVRLAALSALATAEPADAGSARGPGVRDEPPATIARTAETDRVIANALASDRWPEVRRRAATALGARCTRSGPARALGGAVAGDRELDVRTDALTALVQCQAAGVRALLARTWDDAKAPIQLRSHAVKLVVMLGDPQLATSLVAMLARWRGEAITSAAALGLAQTAAATIGQLGPPGAAPALLDALDDAAFPEIVSAAALALGALGPACPPAAKRKLETLARTDDPAAVAARRGAAQCGRK